MFLLLAYIYCKAYRAKRPSLDVMNKSALPVKGKFFWEETVMLVSFLSFFFFLILIFIF